MFVGVGVRKRERENVSAAVSKRETENVSAVARERDCQKFVCLFVCESGKLENVVDAAL